MSRASVRPMERSVSRCTLMAREMFVLSQIFGDLDSCRYLFMREISEPGDNQLRLLVEEARATEEVRTAQVCGVELSGHPIESTEECQLFEVLWESYVAYSVRNESFVSKDDFEEFSGRLIRVYSKSHFLEYASRATFACNELPGPMHHFGLICQNHIIDVISTGPPSVRKLRY